MPFGPALPKGVRTPSTKTTSRSERDMGPPQQFGAGRYGTAPIKLPASNQRAKRGASLPRGIGGNTHIGAADEVGIGSYASAWAAGVRRGRGRLSAGRG